MLESLTLLLVCQLVGEIAARATDMPLPGPVIGMILLFLGLLVKGGVPEPLQAATQGLLEHLSLLFVPAGVGILLHVSLVSEEWLPITAALIASTVLAIAVTALVMHLLLRVTEHDDGGEEGER